MRHHLLKALNIAIGVVAVVGFTVYAVSMASTVDMTRLSTPSAIVGMAIAALSSALIIPISAFSWMHLLRSSGIEQHWGRLSIIMGMTQLGKYLPGNIAQHIGRLAMSIRAGIPTVPFATTVASESLLAIISAVFFGALACALGGGAGLRLPLGTHDIPVVTVPVLLAASAVALGAVFMAPRIINRIARSRFGVSSPAIPATGPLVLAFCCYVGNYLVLSIGIWALSHLIFTVPPSTWLLSGAFALSWIVGFLLPGAPAGLGVRETAMLAILATAEIGAEALPLIIGLRVATTAGDLLCFLVAALAARIAPPHASPPL